MATVIWGIVLAPKYPTAKAFVEYATVSLAFSLPFSRVEWGVACEARAERLLTEPGALALQSLGPGFKGVSSDVWSQLLEFVQTVGIDLSGWSEEDACSSFFLSPLSTFTNALVFLSRAVNDRLVCRMEEGAGQGLVASHPHSRPVLVLYPLACVRALRWLSLCPSRITYSPPAFNTPAPISIFFLPLHSTFWRLMKGRSQAECEGTRRMRG
jgi:hypothetical protein